MNEKSSIIKSIIDNDLYKFTQQQAVVELFQREWVKYNFINRGGTKFPDGFDLRLRQELKKMEQLSLKQEEANFLTQKCGSFLKPTYIDFLKSYRYDSSEIGITQDGGELTVNITGYWYRTILWEVPLMALISELYFQMTGEKIKSRSERHTNNIEKGKKFHMNGMKVADFGTRRRYSYDNQLEVVEDLLSCFDNGSPFLVGTSNVHIAMKTGIQPIGTHAHEWVSAIAALKGYNYANKNMMDDWVKVYRGELGIVLTDTFGFDAFLRDFDTFYAKLFDGVRHDSGDPYEFADKIVAHYKKMDIDPISKTIVFSDGLNPEISVNLAKYCKNIIKTSFGIGTNLTNDVGIKPLNMVIKLIKINGNNAIKLSDVPGKHTGDLSTINMVKKFINY
jgi:nicotinate phosphoribosyltransferase